MGQAVSPLAHSTTASHSKHCLTLWKARLEELFFQEYEVVFWQWGHALIRAAWSPPAWVRWSRTRRTEALGRAGMSVLAAASASRPSGVIQEQLSVPGMAKGSGTNQRECGKVQGARTCSHCPTRLLLPPQQQHPVPSSKGFGQQPLWLPSAGGFGRS